MNVFRILGDLSHLLAMMLLLGKIWRSKSCAGICDVAGGTQPAQVGAELALSGSLRRPAGGALRPCSLAALLGVWRSFGAGLVVAKH
ncbi:hypothetical protein QTO34_018024 [Cnephaeus nilssonii]|uniref:Uncharacterized protein n=1 Tax=Cnephaeus nilssonii TaxID=3371016 RepID=A0AA40LS33_CNENI|nr:hypothetical protein QTO34_018024 [Eptesicus nilssonii]